MDPGDLIFYGVIAVSVVSSILKALKKKPEGEASAGMPDFKGSRPVDIFKTILEEIREKEDDFIPSNPEPVPPIRKTSATKPAVEPVKRPNLASVFEKTRTATENMPRRESFSVKSTIESIRVQDDLSDPVLQSLDLSQADELKKAIIYSEILRPKF